MATKPLVFCSPQVVFSGTPKTTLPLPCGAPIGELLGKGRKTFATWFFFPKDGNSPLQDMKKAQKKPGRPPMLIGKRIHIIKAKLTDEELKALIEIQKASGLHRMELIRRRVLGKGAPVIINVNELLHKLDAIGAELGRAGNNINQLARHANTLNKQGNLKEQVVREFNNLFADYIHMQQELERQLRHILRTMKSS
ncbi:MobC family plasmid mobilization relaxosome protein [Sphingobacterium sp. ML3W]|uniref:plasmid mobilization protein n=1 Tax=Sphingobacterium sp. ML3W TaxID=1538644 RepID=UPI002499C42E|nr:plasmid mobilization relaxosome protein MobC [Sphingobacterium sp. ML3W]WFA81392.1 MobC family plasmid mobilization relaxosome protein [Sphingobacterium sp. ML3W]